MSSSPSKSRPPRDIPQKGREPQGDAALAAAVNGEQPVPVDPAQRQPVTVRVAARTFNIAPCPQEHGTPSFQVEDGLGTVWGFTYGKLQAEKLHKALASAALAAEALDAAAEMIDQLRRVHIESHSVDGTVAGIKDDFEKEYLAYVISVLTKIRRAKMGGAA